jgi:signal transduction histidine kinase
MNDGNNVIIRKEASNVSNWNLLLSAILVMTLSAFVTLSALAEDVCNISIIVSSDDKMELVSFVESAVAFAQENGKEMALKEFNNKTGQFVSGELFIYAYDFNGTCLASPAKPEWIGQNKQNETDPNDVLILKGLINIVANEGKGFMYFIFPNPAHENNDEMKLGYVAKVDDNWWLGSGLYF